MGTSPKEHKGLMDSRNYETNPRSPLLQQKRAEDTQSEPGNSGRSLHWQPYRRDQLRGRVPAMVGLLRWDS